MMSREAVFILHWAVSGFAVLLTSKIIPGFKVEGFVAAVIAAAVIGFANAIIWPVLFLLTLPLSIVTLGLFVFVLNGAILKMCAALLPGFKIDTWLAAIFGSMVLSMTGMFLHWALV